MSKTTETVGIVTTVHGSNNYRVEVGTEEAPREILCHLSGKMCRFRINIQVGDEVTVDIPPPYDRGRITFRGVKGESGASSERGKAKRKKGRR